MYNSACHPPVPVGLRLHYPIKAKWPVLVKYSSNIKYSWFITSKKLYIYSFYLFLKCHFFLCKILFQQLWAWILALQFWDKLLHHSAAHMYCLKTEWVTKLNCMHWPGTWHNQLAGSGSPPACWGILQPVLRCGPDSEQLQRGSLSRSVFLPCSGATSDAGQESSGSPLQSWRKNWDNIRDLICGTLLLYASLNNDNYCTCTWGQWASLDPVDALSF